MSSEKDKNFLSLKDSCLSNICKFLNVRDILALEATGSDLRIALATCCEWERKYNALPVRFKSQTGTFRKRVLCASHAHQLAVAPVIDDDDDEASNTATKLPLLTSDPFTNHHDYEFYCQFAIRDNIIYEGFVPFGPTNWELIEVVHRYGTLLPPDPEQNDERAIPTLRVNLSEIFTKQWGQLHSYIMTERYRRYPPIRNEANESQFRAALVAVHKRSLYQARRLVFAHGFEFSDRSRGSQPCSQVCFKTGSAARLHIFPRDISNSNNNNTSVVEYIWEIKKPGEVEAFEPPSDDEAIANERNNNNNDDDDNNNNNQNQGQQNQWSWW